MRYEEEWLVNILDDLEESVGINIELDARIYKYDTVSFDFEQTSARAMLQMMGDGPVVQVADSRRHAVRLQGAQRDPVRRRVAARAQEGVRERQKALKEAEKSGKKRKKSGGGS